MAILMHKKAEQSTATAEAKANISNITAQNNCHLSLSFLQVKILHSSLATLIERAGLLREEVHNLREFASIVREISEGEGDYMET